MAGALLSLLLLLLLLGVIFVYALRFASCNHNLIKPTATTQAVGRGAEGGVADGRRPGRLDNISIGNIVVDVRAMCLLSSTVHLQKILPTFANLFIFFHIFVKIFAVLKYIKTVLKIKKKKLRESLYLNLNI